MPQSWATAAPAFSCVAPALSGSRGVGAAPAVGAGPGGTFGGMPMLRHDAEGRFYGCYPDVQRPSRRGATPRRIRGRRTIRVVYATAYPVRLSQSISPKSSVKEAVRCLCAL